MSKNIEVNKNNMYEVASDILHDMTIEQLAHYATKFATQGVVTGSGYVLPQTAAGGIDAIFGVDTDFPVPIAMGQTWNTGLMDKIGNVIGTEVRGRFDLDDPNTLVFSAVSDMRGNPLCGRYYETFSEDSFLTNQMAAAMCGGIRGKDDFYLLGQPATKHYFGYQAEWDRNTSSNYFDKRTLMDEQLKGFYDALRSGEAIGVMTSFGGTNGLPNALALYNDEIPLPDPYHLYSISDFNNDFYLSTGLGNGFDQVYVNNSQYIAALMIKARTTSNNIYAFMVSEQDFVSVVQDGILDVTREDLEEMIRPQVELWLRTGLYSQKEYPYTRLCKDYTPLNSSDNGHKAVAMQAAEEGIVLLKNTGNLLPLSPDKNVLVTGILADTLIKPFYAVLGEKDFEHAHLTLYEAVKERAGEGVAVTYDDNLFLTNVYLRSETNQKYLKIEADGYLYASADDTASATMLQIIDWGQDVYSIRKAFTHEYMQYNGSDICFSRISKTDKIPVFTYEDWNGTRAMRYGAVISDMDQVIMSNVPFYEFYISKGNYLLVNSETGQIILDDIFRKEPLDSERFVPVEAANVNDGVDLASYEYAVVAVGIPAYIDASEFVDRPSMSIGTQQAEIVKNIAARFSGRTIVLVCTEFPLDITEIKDNPDVAAVVFYPYSGQYGGWALARTLYGDVNPSGKLTITWPNNKDRLPKLKPETWIDPRYTVNMKETEPSSNKMTYLYQTENIMYPFGYGLSYSSFESSDVTAELTGDSLKVSLNIRNVSRAGKEVVQVYAVKRSAFYGTYMPLKKLVGFAKTDVIAENESVSIEIDIPLERLSQWFGNIGRYAVEEGAVDIIVAGTGYQSEVKALEIPGETIPPTYIFRERNVWDIACYTDGFCGSEVSKTETMLKHTFHCACETNKETGYIVIPKVAVASGILTVRVAATGDGTVEIHTNSIDGECLGIVDVSDTGAAEYELVSRENNRIITGSESKYVNKEVSLQVQPAVVDLYIVVKGSGIKIDSICLRREGATTDWPVFQGNADNNGAFTADYNLMTAPVTDTALQISLPDGNYGSMGGESLTYAKDGRNYVFTQYSDDINGIHMRAYDAEDPETVLWDRQLYKDIRPAVQLSTPVIVKDTKYGDVIFAVSTQYDRVFGTFTYPMTVSAKASNTLSLDKVRIVGHYHVIKVDTGLAGFTPHDLSASVTMVSATHTYEFQADYQGGAFIIDLDAALTESKELIPAGQYTFTITIDNKTDKEVSAVIQILIPYWELSRIRDITGSAVVTRLITASGEANTPVKQFDDALYFGIYDAYGCYFRFLTREYRVVRCNPEAGDGFYWAGISKVSVSGKDYLVCGSELGNIYLMDENSSFTSIGGAPVKTVPLSGYLENAGAVRSSICHGGEYIYFTSLNGYLWRAEIKTLMDEQPKFEYVKLSGKSSSTPVIVGDYAFAGTYAEQDGRLVSGTIDIVNVANGSFEKVSATGDVGPVCASPIVSREDGSYYIYFTTDAASGHGYCYLFKDNLLSTVWETQADHALQGMSAGDGFLVYGDGNKKIHIIR